MTRYKNKFQLQHIRLFESRLSITYYIMQDANGPSNGKWRLQVDTLWTTGPRLLDINRWKKTVVNTSATMLVGAYNRTPKRDKTNNEKVGRDITAWRS